MPGEPKVEKNRFMNKHLKHYDANVATIGAQTASEEDSEINNTKAELRIYKGQMISTSPRSKGSFNNTSPAIETEHQ